MRPPSAAFPTVPPRRAGSRRAAPPRPPFSRPGPATGRTRRTDRIRFETCSYTLPAGQTCTAAAAVVRQYRSFSQASDENGLSRIMVGFHFRKAVDEGIAHGVRIGDWTVDNTLRRVR